MRTVLDVAELACAVVIAFWAFRARVSQWSKRMRQLVPFGVLWVAVAGVYGLLFDRASLPSLAVLAAFLIGPTRGYLADRRADRSPA